MSKKPKNSFASWQERTKQNDPALPVGNFRNDRPRPRQSSLAIDDLRMRRCAAHSVSAKESRPRSLLALAGGVAEIPYSVFVAGGYRQPPGLVAPSRNAEARFVLRDAA